MPIDPKYLNFKNFILDPDIVLQIDPTFKTKKAGRPKK